MTRSRGRWAVVAVLALTAGPVGCAGPDTTPVDSGLPDPSAPPARSLPPVTGTWAGLSEKCPRLTGATAGTLFVSGPGTPTPGWRQLPEVIEADCHWGTDHGNSVDAKVEVWARQAAADAGWRIIADTMTEQLPVGQQGFLTEAPFTAIVAYARSNNVLVSVRLLPPGATGGPVSRQALDKLRPYAKGITEDVLDDLVPA